jgi:hypothetical protein
VIGLAKPRMPPEAKPQRASRSTEEPQIEPAGGSSRSRSSFAALLPEPGGLERFLAAGTGANRLDLGLDRGAGTIADSAGKHTRPNRWRSQPADRLAADRLQQGSRCSHLAADTGGSRRRRSRWTVEAVGIVAGDPHRARHIARTVSTPTLAIDVRSGRYAWAVAGSAFGTAAGRLRTPERDALREALCGPVTRESRLAPDVHP